MSVLLQIGISYPHEMRSGIGHVACTLGGVNYESRGGRGVLKGSAARGATHPLFRHHFHLVLTDQEAARAKTWADHCVGLSYVWGAVPRPAPRPSRGGDCSGLVSSIFCAARGKPPARLFSTGTWTATYAKLGCRAGLGGRVLPDKADPVGRADRPYPGFPIERNSPKRDHIRWIQARLNYAAGNRHPVLGGAALDVDGEFGPKTLAVVKAFQKSVGLEGLGMVGPKTWAKLNAVR